MRWSLVVTVLFKLIDLLLTHKRKDPVKAKLFDYLDRHNDKVFKTNPKLKAEYDRIRKERNS